MRKKLNYSTKYWEEEKDLLIGNVQEDETFIIKNLDRFVSRLKDHEKFNVINSYCTLASAYAIYGEKFYVINKDIFLSKGYFYLAAKAREMSYLLFNQGIESSESVMRELKDIEVIEYYSICAILANKEDLALKFLTPDSLIGALILEEYDKALRYVVDGKDDAYVDSALESIANNDEKGLQKNIESRIKMLRKQSSLSVTLIDIYGLGILKLAKKRGMKCDIEVAELPEELIDAPPIDYTKWQLPIPNEVKRLLE